MGEKLTSRIRTWSHVLFRLTAAVVFGLCGVLLKDCSVVQSMNHITYDMRVASVARTEVANTNIVVIAIDDNGLQEAEPVFGRWPWPRVAHAAIIAQCSEADVFAMDVLLPERVQEEGILKIGEDEFLDRVNDHQDFVAAAALTQQAQVAGSSEEMEMRFSLFAHNADQLSPHKRSFLIPPYPRFSDQVDALGFVNIFPDPGGTVRNYPMFIQHGEKPYPSFALAILSRLQEDDKRLIYVESPTKDDSWLSSDHRISLRGVNTYVNHQAEFQIVYTRDHAPLIPVMSVINSYRREQSGLDATFPRSYFKDKVVLLGSTATGMQDDRHATPHAGRLPGALIHANAIDNLLSGKQFRNTPPIILWSLCFLMALSPWLTSTARPQTVFLVSFLTAAGFLLLIFAAANSYWMLPAIPPLASWLFSLTAHAGYRWDSEQRHAKNLERLDNAKQQFTDMLVHDLKGQVGNLGLSIEMLQTMELEPGAKILIDAMASSGQRLLAQSHSLLDIRRMEDGRMPLNPRATGLTELLDRAVQDYRPSAELVDLKLNLEHDATLNRSVNLDPDLFQRVLANLVLNAIQYAESGSTIVVRNEVKGDDVIVSIENSGRNIPDGARHTLFQPFQYFDMPKSNTRVVSTGLGLAFCKLAVDAHHGKIALDSPLSENQAGVRVTITLPLNKADA